MTRSALWSAMCFAFSGFEITSFIGQEIRDPERTIPRGIFIGGLAATLVYIAGSASVLVAVPFASLKELSGITDAVQLVAGRVGLTGLGALTGALLALNALAGNASWTAGAARDALRRRSGLGDAAGIRDGSIRSTGRRTWRCWCSRWRRRRSFSRACSSAVAGRATSIQEAYDILVNLTILIYFMPYLYLFAAQVRLAPESPRRRLRCSGSRQRRSPSR